MIELIESNTIFDNPSPQLRSRHAYFPGLVELQAGELLALFVVGEAFESVDLTTCVSRSRDRGRTWEFQGPLFDKAAARFPTSDTVKATVLKDRTLIAMGYRFHRHNPDEPIGNPKTGGVLQGDDIVSFSKDGGRSWSAPQIIPRSCPELLEISGPCIELRSGDLLASSCPYLMWDGTSPSGQIGILLRSTDGGRTWDDTARYFTTPGNHISPYETRLCEMEDGRVVVIVWAFDQKSQKNLSNRVVVSHDDGRTWSNPIDTGVMAQASNLMWFGGDCLLSIHAHREGEVGLYVRIVDFAGDRWKIVEEKNIWSKARPQTGMKTLADVFGSIRFGQPSLLRLSNGDILATHWCIEEGQGKIRTHRLRVEL